MDVPVHESGNTSAVEMDIDEPSHNASDSGDSSRANSGSDSDSGSSSSSSSGSGKSRSSSRKSKSSSRKSVSSSRKSSASEGRGKSDSEGGSRSVSHSDVRSSSSESEKESSKNESRSSQHHSEQSEVEEDGQVKSESGSSPPERVTKTSRSKKNLHGLKQLWEENPEEFGIRRSGRSRKEPERYNIGEDSDASDGKKSRRTKKRKDSQDWRGSYSDSDSDASVGAPRRRPPARAKTSASQRSRTSRSASKKKSKPIKVRKKRLSSESDDESYYSDSDNGKKVSLRQTRKNFSYKEQSAEETGSEDLIEVDYGEAAMEEESAECIEKVLEHRIGKKGATGGATTVYTVDDFGDPNDCNATETEEQFLIKWKGWSYLHNTWESEATLKEQKVNGIKKLENYRKQQDELKQWKSRASPEDVEFYECKQELEYDLRQQHMNLERIIAHGPSKSGSGDEMEYFCKWSGLPYAECTWEEGSVISKKFQKQIDDYFARIDSQKIPGKGCKVFKIRPKFIPLKTQPKYVGDTENLILRDYQLDGLNWLAHSWCKGNSVILADEMGLGKTIQTISFLSYLSNQHSLYGPFLLVVPLSTMTSWQREFEQWCPELNVVTYVGDMNSRSVIRQYEWTPPESRCLRFNVLLTTYELLLKDKTFLAPISWAVLGVDEAHRLKNDDSLLYKSLFEFDTKYRLLITGTPLQNSLRELWALLHFIMPLRFESWEDFEAEHKDTADKGYPKLHKELEPFIIRRVKKDVEKSLPAKVERILRVEMTSTQKQFYRWILTKNYAALTKGLRGNITSFNNIAMELKKCCNHAMLVRPVENTNNLDQLQLLIKCSGKIVLLDKLLCRLKETGHRVLIFSQMVMMLDILAEYMQLRRFSFQRLDGSIKGEMRKQALDHFNAEGSQDFCFLLSTKAGGLGINLATADTVIIFDSDWNPQNDLQAQARAHRIGQKNQVNIYRLVTKNSIEEDIIERAKRKMVLDHLVIQRMDTTGRITSVNKPTAGNSSTPFNKEELAAIIQFGAVDLFKETGEEDEEPQVDIDEILSRAETREDQPTSAGEELLSAFKVASFNFNEDEVSMQSAGDAKESIKDWSEIIPEEDRKKYEDEVKEREEMDMYLPPRKRKSTKEASKNSDDSESMESESDDQSDDDDKPKKRGRSRREGVRGFTDVEIRRFVKSFKRFPNALNRLDSIAMDAELQEKPMADLKQLGELLKNGCDTAMQEHKTMQEQVKEEESATPPVKKRGRERGPTFKLGNVNINAKTILSWESELEPLSIILPSDAQARKSWVITERRKDPHFDVPWEAEDDSNLLKGVYEHGMGNWESIKMDPNLALGDKILLDGDRKPHAKNLQNRVDYLLKILKKMMVGKAEDAPVKSRRGRKPKAEKAAVVKPDPESHDAEMLNNSTPPKGKSRGRGHKPKEKPALSKAYIENESDSSDNENSQSTRESSVKKPKPETGGGDNKNIVKDSAGLKLAPSGDADDTQKKEKEKKTKGRDAKKNSETNAKSKPKKAQPVMHYTANAEPQIIVEATERDLKEDVFLQCKESMRPIKKYLMRLDMKKTEGMTPEEKTKKFSLYLVKIGRKIDEIVKEHKDAEKGKDMRSNLWIFVSNFTEENAKQLYKIYRQTSKHLEPPENSSEVRKSAKLESQKTPDESGRKGTLPHKDKSSNKASQPHGVKRPSGDGQDKAVKSPKKRYYDNSRKNIDEKERVRKDSYSENESSSKSYSHKSAPNSYNTSHHGYSGSRDGQSNKGQGEWWGHNNQQSGWNKDRYSNDYNKRDRPRSGYQRDNSSSYHRGRPSGEYSFNQDRPNNRYQQQVPSHHAGAYSHYGIRPPYMPQPPPAHSGYGYASPLALMHASPPLSSQPPPPGVGNHMPMDSYGSYQGQSDSWRRRKLEGHKGDSGDYKTKH